MVDSRPLECHDKEDLFQDLSSYYTQNKGLMCKNSACWPIANRVACTRSVFEFPLHIPFHQACCEAEIRYEFVMI